MVISRKSRVKKVILGINIFFVFLYLLVCLVPFLESGKFWLIAMLGLGFPILFIVVFIFLLIWLIKRSKWAWLSFISILISWQQVSAVIGFHFKKVDSEIRTEGTIRVLSWNVSRWDERNKELRGGQSYRKLMLDFIELQQADVLCLQEFFECYDPKYFEANIPVLSKLGYKYYHFFPTSKIFDDKLQSGIAIFSKYMINSSQSFVNKSRIHSEGLCYIDIKVNKKTIRIFNAHLESPGLSKTDFSNETVKVSTGVFGKIKRSYQFRNQQAKMAREQINLSPYPSIICSDLGDIPNSYAYFRLKGNFQDAFLKKGNGLGRTFRFISPTLRIDYIFASQNLRVESFFKPKIPYSDHFPIISDISFK